MPTQQSALLFATFGLLLLLAYMQGTACQSSSTVPTAPSSSVASSGVSGATTPATAPSTTKSDSTRQTMSLGGIVLAGAAVLLRQYVV
jgi:hypothetical protein